MIPEQTKAINGCEDCGNGKDEGVSVEVRLNDIVYDAFDLTPEERRLIETTTKYPYGEV